MDTQKERSKVDVKVRVKGMSETTQHFELSHYQRLDVFVCFRIDTMVPK